MENSFWHSNRLGDGNFVELFKKSFKLYVKSGMMKKMEADINLLRNDFELGGHPVTEDFRAKFFMFITEHYLRKIHCFYFRSAHLTTFFTSP
jgi:hypothetical protein